MSTLHRPRSPTISLLIDARRGPPPSIAAPPGGEVWVAGPGGSVPVPASATEAQTFDALLDAASAPVCVWLNAQHDAVPGRCLALFRAIASLGVAVVGHLPPSAVQEGTGRLRRLPLRAGAQGLLDPDTLVFRRDVARSLPRPPHLQLGVRQLLVIHGATHGGIGWLDRRLLTARVVSRDAAEQEHALAGAVQGALAVLDRLRATGAPAPAQQAALQALMSASLQWSTKRWTLLCDQRKPRWRGAEEAQ